MLFIKSLALIIIFLIHSSSSEQSKIPLTSEEQSLFIRKTFSWIHGHDIIDTCIVLNFGFDSPLPWPQVDMIYSSKYFDNLYKLVLGEI